MLTVDTTALKPVTRDIVEKFITSFVTEIVEAQARHKGGKDWTQHDLIALKYSLQWHVEHGTPMEVAVFAAVIWARETLPEFGK